MLLALPIAAWELSVGVYMTVKGFRTPPADVDTHNTDGAVPFEPAVLAHA
jgi:hypothetical protein